jgi:hypothetical protein
MRVTTHTAPTTAVNPVSWALERDPFGRLAFTDAQGQCVQDVVPVRAFPIQSPQEGIALVSQAGHEVVWIDALSQVPEPAQTLIVETLASREFIPVILKIAATTSFSTPCTWSVQTDRGHTSLVLRGDEDIRRIGTANALLVADVHAIQYLIPDQFALDAGSRKILDRFL